MEFIRKAEGRAVTPDPRKKYPSLYAEYLTRGPVREDRTKSPDIETVNNRLREILSQTMDEITKAIPQHGKAMPSVSITPGKVGFEQDENIENKTVKPEESPSKPVIFKSFASTFRNKIRAAATGEGEG